MTKSILTIAATLAVAFGSIATTAEAGSSCGGARGGFSKSYSASPRSVSQASYQRKSVVASKVAQRKPTAVAAATPEVKQVKAANQSVAAVAPAKVEKSAVSEASVAPLAAEAVEAVEKVAGTSDLGCKRFIPAAGLTISVPCAQ